MRKLYTLGYSRCRLQSRAQVGASSPFPHCTRFVFVLLLLLGGVVQGAVGQVNYDAGYPKISNQSGGNVTFAVKISGGYRGVTFAVYVTDASANAPTIEDVIFGETESGETLSPRETVTIGSSTSEVSLSFENLSPGDYKAYCVTSNGSIAVIETDAPTVIPFTIAPAAIAPTYTALSPANLDENVSLFPTLSMTFDEAVVKGSGLLFLGVHPKLGGQSVYVNVDAASIDGTGKIVSVPVSDLIAGTEYYVSVSGGFVQSTSGVPFAGISEPATWTFTTGSAPQLAAENPLFPIHGATNVALGAVLSVQFDKDIQFNSTSTVKNIYIEDGSGSIKYSYTLKEGSPAPEGLSISGTTLTIDNTDDYEYATDYQVIIQDGAIESTSGIPYGGLTEGNWNFRTLDAPAPVGTMAAPVASDVNISILTDVVINYDMAIRNVDGTAITDANVKNLINIYQGTGDGVLMDSNNYTATIAADKKSITIKMLPGSSYLPNTNVRVVINAVENNQAVEQNLAQAFAFKTGYYNIWLGTTDSDWTKASNWEGEAYTPGASVIIKNSSNGAVLSSSLSIANMIIAAGGKLTIDSGAALTVTSYFRMFSVNGTGASASLVVDGTLTTDATKTFVYQGITNSAFNYYVSSPVNAAVKSLVNPDGRMYAYNTATDVFDRLADDALLTPLKGYGAMAPAGSWLSFSGSLNGGDYSLSCYRTAKNYGWNLAGNPYPCAIDLQKTYDAGGFSNLRDHIYIRDNETFIQNAYNFYSKVGTLSGNAVVPAMHSFWVQVKPGFSEGTFSVKNTDRVHNSFNYHKSASATPVQKPTIKLFAQNGAVKDLSVITFIPGNDDAYDAYDSEKRLARSNLVTDLYTIKDGMRLVINSFGEYVGSKEVPLGVYAKKAGTYKLGIASLAGFDQEVELKLVDYGTSPATTHDLSTGDYSFTVVADTYIDHRFVLQVSNKVATGVEQPEASREVTIYAFHSDVVIENKGDAIGQYTIYDLSGRVLTSGEVGAFSKISVPMLVKGVVLGVVKTSKGIVNQKLLIQ